MSESSWHDANPQPEPKVAISASRFIESIQKAINGTSTKVAISMLKEVDDYQEATFCISSMLGEDEAIALAFEFGRSLEFVDERLGMEPGKIVSGDPVIESKYYGPMENSWGNKMLIQFKAISKP